jgi:hypothetical protein
MTETYTTKAGLREVRDEIMTGVRKSTEVCQAFMTEWTVILAERDRKPS